MNIHILMLLTSFVCGFLISAWIAGNYIQKKLRKRNERSLRFQKTLLELAKMNLSELDSFFSKVTEMDARELEVERVSIWLFQNEQAEIFCHDLYLASKDIHENGVILHAKDYPNYFKELEKSRTIAANDAQIDPRTCEFASSYLQPLQIFSMLDVPIWLQGKVKGIVCHEQVGSRRKWSLEEQEFVASIASLISLSMENAQLQETQRELQLKSEELEHSNKELQSFAYVASHDLQEPLHKIIAFGDRLRANISGELDPVALDSLDRIQKSAMGMRDLIHDLLLYSRMAKRDLPFEKISLNDLMKEVLKELELRVLESQATIMVESLPDAKGDWVQLKQLFLNLIANALKFAEKGTTPWVKVSGNIVDTYCIEITVEDHGIGVDKKYEALIFKPFERLHPKNQFPGTGMGLAICQKIAMAHRGSIAVKSQVGAGTAFTVTLPRG